MRNIQTCLTAVLMTTILAACTTSLEPIDDGDPEDPEGPEPTVVEYDVKLTFTRLEAKGDCDPDVLFGIDNPGEFSYRVGYRVQLASGSSTAITYVHETDDFRSEDGERVKIKTGESHELGRSRSFTLSENEGYTVYLNSAEWDPANVDSRMHYEDEEWNNFTVGDQTGTVSFEVSDGDTGDCKLALHGRTVETRK